MLSIDDLTVGYGRRVVISGLDLKLESGRVHGLVGRNGAGKTTLLEAIAGFLRPRTGTILVDGAPPTPRTLGYLPMENHFYPKITGREYLRVFDSRGTSFDADAWAELFSLPLDHPIDGYSAGMRKKLALLGVLSLDRKTVLLDEPTNGLDLESNLLLGHLLRELADAGRTVLVTSHTLDTLARVSDEIHVLEDGRIARSFAREEFGALESFLTRGEARAARLRELLRS